MNKNIRTELNSCVFGPEKTIVTIPSDRKITVFSFLSRNHFYSKRGKVSRNQVDGQLTNSPGFIYPLMRIVKNV